MTERELEVLLAKFGDDSLTAQEHRRLADELDCSEEARQRLAHMAEVAFAIAEAARTRAIKEERRRPVALPLVQPRAWWRVALPWAALVAFVVPLGWWLWHASASRTFLEVVDVRGAVSGSFGGKRLPLVQGLWLPPGTIETESETATIEVRFADGTRFVLQGNAEALFNEEDGKRVFLRRGTALVDVAKQPSKKKLRVRTGTAEVEVLGTAFAIEAAPQATSVSVVRGRVLLRRLVDGRTVEVAPQEYATASLAAGDNLAPKPVSLPAGSWTFNLQTAPAHFTGQWRQAEDGEPARIIAAPIIERRESDGVPYVHYGVIIRAAAHPADSFVALGEDSVLRIKLRMQKPFPLQLIASTRHGDGSFAGNFELMKLHPGIIPGAEWQILEVPLRDFTPLHPSRSTHASGLRACTIIVTTLHESVGLEIAGVFVGPQHQTLQ